MPLSFFAPHVGYSRSGGEDLLHEFKSMVKALHQAGIEVILDVVYNHTTEFNETGPTYNFRGIDNSTYYLLEADWSRYRNDSGTGNVVHCGNRYVRAMILDSLRFWVREMHVDGFRFDLASIFTRDNEGQINLNDPPIISEITSDPDFAGIRLIAEAWDLASISWGEVSRALHGSSGMDDFATIYARFYAATKAKQATPSAGSMAVMTCFPTR